MEEDEDIYTASQKHEYNKTQEPTSSLKNLKDKKNVLEKKRTQGRSLFRKKQSFHQRYVRKISEDFNSTERKVEIAKLIDNEANRGHLTEVVNLHVDKANKCHTSNKNGYDNAEKKQNFKTTEKVDVSKEDFNQTKDSKSLAEKFEEITEPVPHCKDCGHSQKSGKGPGSEKELKVCRNTRPPSKLERGNSRPRVPSLTVCELTNKIFVL